MGVVVAHAAPSNNTGQIVARPQWKHSNLALFLNNNDTQDAQVISTAFQTSAKPTTTITITTCNGTHVHVEFVDLGEHPSDGAITATY